MTQTCIVAALTLGGLTTVYPFAIMVSGALRSELDESDLDLVPRYFVDDTVLYRKFLETKYNQDVAALNRAHCRAEFSFRDATRPEPLVPRRVDDLTRFLEETQPPRHWQVLGGTHGVRTVPEKLRELRDRLATRYHGDFAAYQREAGVAVTGWNTIIAPPPEWLTQRFDYPRNALYDTYFELLDEAPLAERQLVSLTGCFLQTMIYPVYGQGDTDAYNAAHTVVLRSFEDLTLPETVPGLDQPRLRDEWLGFVRQELSPSFVLLRGVGDGEYHAYLRRQHGSVEDLNRMWSRSFGSFEEIRLPAGQWLSGAERTDYQEFLTAQAPEAYRLTGPEYAWRAWLRRQYPTVADLSAAHQADYTGFDTVRLPVDHLELAYTLDHASGLRRTYASRNFTNVLRELVLRGGAFANTVVLCVLSICVALLVNPLAAYSLSRFRLRGTYKILLFMMATMAFPPMVTMIPAFILLRKLHMLNTYAALIIPFAADGYMIFLLKGFFDSIPRELYEAAMLEGASEFRMFFQVTMALSKPILAVVALGAFNAAYAMFLYALIVCPKQNMWVLSVWLYQWQQTASTSGVFASVILASIPTLLVFVSCQTVIMRGIVVPVEK